MLSWDTLKIVALVLGIALASLLEAQVEGAETACRLVPDFLHMG